MYRLRKAFSLIELIFVIVVLGIVSSIGSEIVAKVYDGYIVQRASFRSSMNTELAATQLANRLTYALPMGVIKRNSSIVPSNLNGFRSFDAVVPNPNAYDILEWVGVDEDSFDAGGWSGLNDLNTTTLNLIATPDSNMTFTNTVITNLSSGNPKTIASGAVFFPDVYDAYKLGFDGNITGINTAVSGGTNLINLIPTAMSRTMKEHYKFAWSAYAVVPGLENADGSITVRTAANPDVNRSNGTYDLILVYNYQPWLGQNYTNGSRQVLIKDVSVFKFTGAGDTIRFKICKQERISETDHITSCKEKAVIR